MNCDLTYSESVFLNSLGRGKGDAIKAKDLNFSSRDLRFMANSLRRKGYPVCSGNAGYWLAESMNEAKETISRFRSQANEMSFIADCLERNVERFYE